MISCRMWDSFSVTGEKTLLGRELTESRGLLVNLMLQLVL